MGARRTDPSSGVVEFYDDKNLVQAGTDLEVLAGQVTTRIDAVFGNVNGPPIGLVDPEFDEGVTPWAAASLWRLGARRRSRAAPRGRR